MIAWIELFATKKRFVKNLRLKRFGCVAFLLEWNNLFIMVPLAQFRTLANLEKIFNYVKTVGKEFNQMYKTLIVREYA